MKRLTRFDLTMVIEPQVLKLCRPLFLTSSTETPEGNIVGSGTCGFIHTGDMNLLVTCEHGLREFIEKHSENPGIRFGIGLGVNCPYSLSFDELMRHKVDADRRCDLATFDVSFALDLIATCDLEFFDLNANPPPRVQVGDILYLVGFPAKGRIESERLVGFPRTPFGVRVSEVGDATFFSRPQKMQLDETDYGGISGAPCFIVKEAAPIRLAGFATGFAPKQMNMLQFTYARYIGKDGIIRYHT